MVEMVRRVLCCLATNSFWRIPWYEANGNPTKKKVSAKLKPLARSGTVNILECNSLASECFYARDIEIDRTGVPKCSKRPYSVFSLLLSTTFFTHITS